jgi:hypothetical protein
MAAPLKGRMAGHRAAKHTYVCRDCALTHQTKTELCIRCHSKEMQHFPSKAQAKRYVDLHMLQRQGVVRNLEVEVRFDCVVPEFVSKTKYFGSHRVVSKKICTYIADAVYEIKLDGEWVFIVEDVKGKRSMGDTSSDLRRSIAEHFNGFKVSIYEPRSSGRRKV